MCDACDRQFNRRVLLRRAFYGATAAASASLWLPEGVNAADSDTSLEDAALGQDAFVAQDHPQGGATGGSTSTRVTPAPAASTAASSSIISSAAVVASPNKNSYKAPPIITRKQWGARESIRLNNRYFAPVRKLIVHHSASPNKPSSPSEVVRSIEQYHIKGRGFDDIGYNYLIDHKGAIYEGRAARQFSSGEAISAEDGKGWGIVGGHAKAFNAGSVGVCLIGDFEKATPTDAMIGSLIWLLSWKASRHRIDARGDDDYISIYGKTTTTKNISGHGQVGYTQCPGSKMKALLPMVRDQVANNAGNWKSQVINMAAVMRYETGPLKTSSGTTSTDTSNSGTGGGTSGGGSTGSSGSGGGTSGGGSTGSSGSGSSAKTGIIGYRVISETGQVFTAGKGTKLGNAKGGATVALANGRKGDGYWALSAKGIVTAFGALGDYGSPGDKGTAVDLGATSTGGGYAVLMEDGGIYPFGDALHHGSTKKQGVGSKARKITLRPQGDGYWVLTSDNAIRAFGNAKSFGSPKSGTVVDVCSTPTGKGYWALLSNGAVAAYGDAADKGDVPSSGTGWKKAAAHILATPTGNGYVISNSEGSLRVFGDAPMYQSFGGSGMNATGLALVF